MNRKYRYLFAYNTACGSAALIARLLSVAIVISLLPLNVSAQQLPQTSVTAVTLSGKQFAGTLRSLTAENLTVAGDSTRQFALDDMLSVHFQQHDASHRPTGPMVFLAGGDRLSLQPSAIDDDALVGSWNSFPSWRPARIPLEQIHAIAFQRPRDSQARHRLTAALLELDDKRDTVFLRNGDRLSGRLLQLANDSLTFEGPVGRQSIQRQNIRALAFNSELISPPKSSEHPVLLELGDRSRVTARRAKLVEPGLLEVETQFGSTLRIPATAVVSLRFLGRRTVYLSNMDVDKYQYTPFLNDNWPLRRDRNVSGGPLRLDGQEYAKGLGMHSQSTARYKLGGDFRRFRATVGIDDSAGKKGSVRFAVEMDGESVFRSGLMTGNDKPIDIGPIDVSGKKQLTLIVEFGDRGDILDHANWCDAVLIK